MTTSSQPQSPLDLSILRDTAQPFLDSSMGTLLLGLVVLWVGMSLFGNSTNKNKLATGRFAGNAERRRAKALGRKQQKQRHPAKVPLKAGDLDIPQAQQSIVVAGAPDSGKTYSIIDPAIRSAIAQGFPIVVYDFKGSQLAAHAAWASSQGYQVDVFAPGQPYTGICNPLDFLEDETDALMASQLAAVLQKNTQRDGGYRDNDFFNSAGTNLVEAVMLLAKRTPYPDLLMANKILNLSNLPGRIRQAGESGWIPPWTMESFNQLIASEEADKQIAGIVATAQRTFKTFTGKQLVSSFCGKTTIPLDMTGKRILFLQVDIQKRDAVSPLLAAILHLIVTRNFARSRSEPLVIALDELPTLYLPDLPKWINEFRSYGFVALLGYQNFAQLQHIYGRDLSRALFAACGTKVFFNPKDRETAQEFSGYLGEKDVRIYTRSRSQGRYGSNSRSEQCQRVPLMTADQILKLDQGECVFINPAYRGGGEAFVPLRVRVKISKTEQAIQARSESLWHSTVQQKLIARCQQQQTLTDLDDENQKRKEIAECLFPLPLGGGQPLSGLSASSDITEDEFDEALR
ncbi:MULTISPECIES: type IV secretory system conjugative DNA transfer family protein [Cyanophyceae]|uniref:Type IV secretion system DNA-binding domain-containing protein n=1 Tax=Leptolyngbya subtilissima DQ-A4 TaxID=2933933 RepID=A0ABV0KAE8_9CYAN|nr:type IV secretory system conjugative DNA transfer family protein [Nodosilinea sp. FACHB-141]MBD2114971.1 type IV secretory system conjugative DNA transfer family protein [Nodosilinea sp. FACHB-141]